MKRGRWVPQRSESERQALIADLRQWQRLTEGQEPRLPGPVEAMRRIEGVLRLDWELGWPEGETARVGPLPLFDLP